MKRYSVVLGLVLSVVTGVLGLTSNASAAPNDASASWAAGSCTLVATLNLYETAAVASSAVPSCAGKRGIALVQVSCDNLGNSPSASAYTQVSVSHRYVGGSQVGRQVSCTSAHWVKNVETNTWYGPYYLTARKLISSDH